MYQVHTSITETRAKIKDCIITLHLTGLSDKRINKLLLKRLLPVFGTERMVRYCTENFEKEKRINETT